MVWGLGFAPKQCRGVSEGGDAGEGAGETSLVVSWSSLKLHVGHTEVYDIILFGMCLKFSIKKFSSILASLHVSLSLDSGLSIRVSLLETPSVYSGEDTTSPSWQALMMGFLEIFLKRLWVEGCPMAVSQIQTPLEQVGEFSAAVGHLSKAPT